MRIVNLHATPCDIVSSSETRVREDGMKILLTNISLHPERGGGTAERTRHLATHLTSQGADCSVAVIEGGRYADELRSNGISVYVTGGLRIKFRIPFINVVRLWRLIRDADAIHVLGYWNLLSTTTCYLARLAGTPYALSAAGEFAALERPRPVAKLFHALFKNTMIGKASSIIAITKLERDQIIGNLKVAPERVIVIPNGIAPPPAVPRNESSLPEGPYILFVGRLAAIKGPDLLLEAFSEIAEDFPEVTLVLAGPDFGMLAELQQKIAEHNLSQRVRLIGFLDEAARTAAYSGAKFVCVPSRAEAMSLVALEAGVMGKPVLLTDQCGFNEVQSTDGGCVVPATVAGIRDGLRSLLTRDQELPDMGARLKSFVLQHYSWPTVAKGLLDHLKSIAARTARTAV